MRTPCSRRPASPTATIQDVLAAAADGDRVARAGLKRVGHWLGVGIANLVNVFNPEVVVFGGVLRQLLPATEAMVRTELAYALAAPREQVRLALPQLAVSAVAQKDLVGVEGEDLGLGKPALDLDGEQRFLHFAIERTVGRKEQIARQLHGEGGRALHFPARFDVAVSSAYDAPEVDARVTEEVFVFDRNQGITENFRVVVIAGDDATLESEGSNHASLSVVEFSD